MLRAREPKAQVVEARWPAVRHGSCSPRCYGSAVFQKINGLSVALLSSMSSIHRPYFTVSWQAPCTWGMHARVGVLHIDVCGRAHERGSDQQPPHVSGTFHLPRMWPSGMETGVVRQSVPRRASRLNAPAMSATVAAIPPHHRQRTQGRHQGGAVGQREALLGCQRHRLPACPFQRLARAVSS